MNDTKWWAGVKSGISFTTAQPTERYSAFEYTQPVNGAEKNYQGIFKGKGPLLGFTFDYAIIPALAISIQPCYQSYFFAYTTQHSWADTAMHRVELNNLHRQKMHYLELPLLIKGGYSFGRFRVHVQGGAYYGKLIHARKTVEVTEKFYDSTSVINLHQFTESFDLFKHYISSQMGIIGGGGISIDINFFRLGLECNYRYALNNITDRKNRYADHRLVSGAYDVPDDIVLRNLEIVLHCSTPLDYLMHMPGFSAKPNRKK